MRLLSSMNDNRSKFEIWPWIFFFLVLISTMQCKKDLKCLSENFEKKYTIQFLQRVLLFGLIFSRVSSNFQVDVYRMKFQNTTFFPIIGFKEMFRTANFIRAKQGTEREKMCWKMHYIDNYVNMTNWLWGHFISSSWLIISTTSSIL